MFIIHLLNLTALKVKLNSANAIVSLGKPFLFSVLLFYSLWCQFLKDSPFLLVLFYCIFVPCLRIKLFKCIVQLNVSFDFYFEQKLRI